MKVVTLILFAIVPYQVKMPATAAVPITTAASASSLSIVTLNLAKENSVDRILAELRGVPELKDADLFLFQEVRDRAMERCIASRLASELGMQLAYSPAASSADLGLAILSRFPLRDIQIRPLRSYNLRFHTRSRFALQATADTPWGPLRLSDAHLDTRLNLAERLTQLEPVVQDSSQFQGMSVIAGDFNSNPFYWVEHVLPLPTVRSQTHGVRDFMTRHGFRTAIPLGATTFDHLGMHLDWIWLNGAHPTVSRVFPLKFSDHHAVWTRVEFGTDRLLSSAAQ